MVDLLDAQTKIAMNHLNKAKRCIARAVELRGDPRKHLRAASEEIDLEIKLIEGG